VQGTTADLDEYIAANATRYVEDLARLCSFDSISNFGPDAMRPCREWLGDRLGSLTSRVDTLEAGGLPSLLAEIPGAGDRKLLLYSHYDVQPVDPIDKWETPPFEPNIRDGRLYARGVCDDKADVMARIFALEAMKAVRGELPVTIRFLIEGEEEIGSKSFNPLVAAHADRLAADGCLWESAGFTSAHRPQVMFGCRGLLYLALRVRMLEGDQHSGLASIFPSAAQYLVMAMASLRDLDMNILIDGFYDDALPPSETDRKMLAAIDFELDDRRRRAGADHLVRNPTPDRALEQLLFMPTCNIAGITTGYQGPGSKTVLPAEATAKLDFRLVPDQDPADILAKLRRHFDSKGFERVEIVSFDAEKPARTDPGSEIARTVIECVQALHGEPELWPFKHMTGPMHPITEGLGIPTVQAPGVGHPDSRIHAPNENIHIADYISCIRLLCRVFERFGAR
jgi:acetylornithine deacetylase/succinyl-diaminopimelate desuccinylase-like protein